MDHDKNLGLDPAHNHQEANKPSFVSGGSEDQPERWKALNHIVAVNRLLGFENRVGLSSRPEHKISPEANEQICLFFACFLNR